MIFISYRRADNAYLASEVRDALVARFGSPRTVFLDIASIPPGVDFASVIRQSIARSRVVIALIGPQWHPDLLSNTGDFVRLELQTAQQLGKVIVPVLHSQQRMPTTAQLPAEFAWLAGINAYSIADPPDHKRTMFELGEHLAHLAGVAGVAGLAKGSELSGPSTRSEASTSRLGSLDFLSETTAYSGVKDVFHTIFRRRTEIP